MFGKFIWTILYTNLDLTGGGTGAGEGGFPLYPPFKIQIFVHDFPYEFTEKVAGWLPVASHTALQRKKNRTGAKTD